MSEPYKCKKNGRIHGYEFCTSQVDDDWVPKCNCTYNCTDSCQIPQVKKKELLTAEAA